MNIGSKILGLAVVLGLVGCFASSEDSTRACNLSATSSEADVPICEGDDVHVDTSAANSLGAANVTPQASDAGNAPRFRMPNNKHPDLAR